MRPTKVRVGVQMIYHLELSLPKSLDYLTWDFQRDIRAGCTRREVDIPTTLRACPSA